MKIIIHYSEIALKGKNRDFFEKVLVDNVRRSLGKDVLRVYRRRGKVVCDPSARARKERVEESLRLLPGVAFFSFAERSGLTMAGLKKAVLRKVSGRKFRTFRVSAKRSNKDFRKTSMELNKELGELIARETGGRVRMENPDLEVFVDVGEKEAFVYTEKFRGMGGLPVGSSGKLVASLSGGIDSPVASALVMKRGCRVVFVHIRNRTIENQGVVGKIEDLVKQLDRLQAGSRLYVVPFEDIQREIIMNVPSRHRMIVYRRFMMRILNRIAEKEKARGIVTGDNIGQVASQTLENMECIREKSGYPVYSPLIGMNKEEIVGMARRFGTYGTSVVPYPDCCSFNIARHPETRGCPDEIAGLESGIKESDKLVGSAVRKARKKDFR